MAPQNYAAVLPSKQAPSMVVEQVPYSAPGSGELVIKTMAVAINPADWIIQKLGVLVQQYPAILGCDVAGVVEEVGPDMPGFVEGDHVIGSTSCLEAPDGVFKYSGFQDYPILRRGKVLVKIPKEVAFTDAAVLPLGVMTASTCLFGKGCLGLNMPPSAEGQGKVVLVWGASSSVGSCGVQLARAAGYDVVGIASKHNHDFVESLGAVECFDQNNENVVDEIAGYLEGKTVVGAYHAVNSTKALGQLCQILDKVGGRKVIASVVPGSEAHAVLDVQIAVNISNVEGMAVIEPLAQDYLEPALAAGHFQYKPAPEVVGHGWGDIQKACDMLSRGVSAKKLVVSLQ